MLVGHSYGGRVAMKYLTMYPETVDAAMILDIAPYDFWNDREYVVIKKIKRGIEDLLGLDTKLPYKEF